MPSTGEKCTIEGRYTGRCARYSSHAQQEAHFTVGDTFTPCSTCGGQERNPGGAVMNWTLVRASK